ncbi:AAC4 [Symbiodinium microadriaticum]|nr:AAC4 [Symbiodinium microadriaticum]
MIDTISRRKTTVDGSAVADAARDQKEGGVCSPYNACHVYADIVIRAEHFDEFLLRKAMKSSTEIVTIIQDTFQRVRFQVAMGTEAQKILDEPNAGGSSMVSEALSAEYLARRFGATNVVTEMAIQYWLSNWKKIDYIATVYGRRVGISVTRAMGFPRPGDFAMENARRLCEKKLFGLVVARAGISEAHSYDRSILHVWCQTDEISNMMYIAFNEIVSEDKAQNPLNPTLSGSITMILTVCDTIEGVYTEDFSCFQEQ